MFISLRSHNLIVEQLREQCAELKAERDWYRDRWTGAQGKTFSQAEPIVEDPDSKRSSEDRDATAPAIDVGWSEDDRDLFKLWQTGNVREGEQPLEAWERVYGQQTPLMALTV